MSENWMNRNFIFDTSAKKIFIREVFAHNRKIATNSYENRLSLRCLCSWLKMKETSFSTFLKCFFVSTKAESCSFFWFSSQFTLTLSIFFFFCKNHANPWLPQQCNVLTLVRCQLILVFSFRFFNNKKTTKTKTKKKETELPLWQPCSQVSKTWEQYFYKRNISACRKLGDYPIY